VHVWLRIWLQQKLCVYLVSVPFPRCVALGLTYNNMHVFLEAGRYRLSVATEHSLNLRRPVTVKLARGAHNKLGIIMHIRSLLSKVEVSISDLLPEILRGHCSYWASILRGFQGAHSGCTQLLVLRFPQRHPCQWKVFEFVTQKSRIVIHHNNHVGGVGKWATVCSFFLR